VTRLAPLAALALAGCATPSLVLLPDEDGGQGAVAVIERRGQPQETVIDQGNRRARLGARVSSRTADLKPAEARLVSELPTKPYTYVLYYDEGATRIDPGSRAQLEALLADAASRPGVEIEIDGHTDRKGTDEDNDRLSEERANAILAQLAEAGIPRENMIAIGRGERDPRVQTEDGVEEVANRRVEVVVR
jgi:outer membrane protein OmpA-like peptidoglycan-associated protein